MSLPFVSMPLVIALHFQQKTNVIVHPFDDPPKLAKQENTPEAALFHYRRVRDEIKDWVNALPTQIN